MKKLVLPLIILTALTACEKLLPKSPNSEDVLAEPIEELTAIQLAKHLDGDEQFAKVYTKEEGLGPIFIQSACENCHVGDGKGSPVNNVTRFGKWNGNEFDYLENLGGPQLQQRGVSPYNGEQIPNEATSISERTPPVNVGLGYLDFVLDSAIMALEDENDLNGDGISGRINWVIPKSYSNLDNRIQNDGKYIGKFGKKATKLDLRDQIIFAFKEDMGLTSDFDPVELFSVETGQTSTDGIADPEVSTETIENIRFYLRTLKAPTRRLTDDSEIMAGENIFSTIGCESCHTKTLVTGNSSVTALNNVEFQPYTDLLIHDMGSELADQYPEEGASGTEWRTAPLWGLGLAADSQGGQAYYLHDGRATSLQEAITWHAYGEASQVVSNFNGLSSEDKSRLIKFLNSL